MVETLSLRSPVINEKTIVVIDAGIPTEDNLKLLKEKGFNYLCVFRTKLKDYTIDETTNTITVLDTRKQEIKLHQVHIFDEDDYYLEVNSPSKAMTEASMNRQWKERFEEDLKKVNESISKKGGTKKYEKVVECVVRAIERYPSIAKNYHIEYVKDTTISNQMKEVKWEIKDFSNQESSFGIYFLRTNIRTFNEEVTWEYYNLIREIETTNRQLKTALNLRPIFYQIDGRSDAHLFFGLLSYWVVNTIRYQLKQKNIRCYWTEIVKCMSTQKLVTTEAINALGDSVELC